MFILNQQWQGSGVTNEIKTGAKILGNFFHKNITHEVELFENDLKQYNGIIAYYDIYKQLKKFRDLIEPNNPKNITTIGGDCGIEIIPVSYLNNLYKNLGIIWLDAHADLNTPESSPSKTFHGMPLRLLLGEGDNEYKKLMFSTIQPEQILYIGLRNTDKSEEDQIKRNNIFHIDKFNYKLIAEKLSKYNLTKLYIHMDLDVINPEIFNYSKCPVKSGLTPIEIESFIIQLQNDFKIVGSSICESIAKNNKQLKPIENILNLFKK